jgi:hypothetical protein
MCAAENCFDLVCVCVCVCLCVCVLFVATCDSPCQNLRWSDVLGALPEVSSKYSNFVSIISNASFRSRMPDASKFSIHNLPRSSNLEFDLLLLLSRSVVLSAADEVYACMPQPRQNGKTPVEKSDLVHLQFFSGFLSCIRGYKQIMDAVKYLRRHVLVQALRRLQGALLISKVYVNCLVSL